MFGQAVELDGVARRRHSGRRLDDDALGAPRRARRVEHDRNVVAARRADRLFPPPRRIRVGGHLLAPRLLDVGKRNQSRMVIIAEPARLVIDDHAEIGDLFRERKYLVDLFLVLHHGEAYAGMVEHIGELLGDCVGVDRHRNRAQRLEGGDRPVEARPVGADDRHPLAMLHAVRLEADREAAHGLELVLPGPALPDAEILVPHGRKVGKSFGVEQQIFRKRIELWLALSQGLVPPGGLVPATFLIRPQRPDIFCCWEQVFTNRKTVQLAA